MGNRATRVTMADVARLAGVSSTTVSHVINRTRYIDPRTEDAVRAAIEQTGYSSDGIARSLRTGTTETVGLAMSALSNPYFADFVHAIEREISDSGFSMVLTDTHDDPEREQRAVSEILSHRVDGLILAPTVLSGGLLEKLSTRGVPTVIIDRIPAGAIPSGMDAIGAENREPIARLVDHLAGMGHRHIGLVSANPNLSSMVEREEGFRLGMARNGLSVNSADLFIVAHGSERDHLESLQRALASPERPTALVVANNEMTISTMKTLRANGISVPDGIALVVFDDFEWSDHFHPRLTAMAQPAAEIGKRAVQLLFERIQDPSLPSRVIRLEPEFRHRDSCGPHD